MLPMTLQFMIVMIASAINDRLQRKLDYVAEERRILREQLDAATGGKRVVVHHRAASAPGHGRQVAHARRTSEVLRPGEAGHHSCLVPPARRQEVRQLRSQTSRRPKPKDVRALVIKLATENL